MFSDVIALHHSSSCGGAPAGRCSVGYRDFLAEPLVALICCAYTSHYLNCKSDTILDHKHVTYCLY